MSDLHCTLQRRTDSSHLIVTGDQEQSSVDRQGDGAAGQVWRGRGAGAQARLGRIQSGAAHGGVLAGSEH